jgi:hypothetical protein
MQHKLSRKAQARKFVTVKAMRTDTIIKRPLINGQTRPQVGGGINTGIKELSDSSLRRMKLHARNMEHASYIITLTYPKDFPSNGKTVKRHLEAMREWFKRHGISAFWFLEFQARGAPHFHLFTDNPVEAKELSRKWYEVVGSGDEKHLRAGTQIQKIRKPHAIAAYAAKYATKKEQKAVPEGYSNVGRFWGGWGKYRTKASTVLHGEEFRDETKLDTDKNAQAIYSAIRSAKKFIKAHGYKIHDKGIYGLTLWGVSAAIMVKLTDFYGYNGLTV